MECLECKNRKPYHKSTGVTCPKCGQGVIVERKSKRGTLFYGCNKYPECDFVLWNEPIDEKCPKCNSLFTKKTLKNGTTIVCSKCGFKKEEVQADE
jgi:DNA topoisomerase-1